jgi:outer membrane lipoprotein-sorting protein
MIISTVRFVAILAVALAGAAIRGAELPILAKARSYLGSEEALRRVHTIHYTGTLVTTSPTEPNKQTRAGIEIILEKPDRQRVTIKTDTTIETTALDGYDGWTRTTAASDPTKWQQTLLGVEGIKRLRANTWENVAFYRGLEAEGGQVKDMGTATIDGVECEKVAFVHAPNIIFYRYFDLSSGRVVYSETETGGSIKEQGEIVVDGVRFPKSIITVSKNAAGQSQTVTITFDKVTLNENLPASFFAVPSLANR